MKEADFFTAIAMINVSCKLEEVVKKLTGVGLNMHQDSSWLVLAHFWCFNVVSRGLCDWGRGYWALNKYVCN